MHAITKAEKIIAMGLARPSSRLSSPGTPKMPLPMMQLITRPVIAHRPIERTKPIGPLRCQRNAAEGNTDAGISRRGSGHRAIKLSITHDGGPRHE